MKSYNTRKVKYTNLWSAECGNGLIGVGKTQMEAIRDLNEQIK